jgi:hypothetical protein
MISRDGVPLLVREVLEPLLELARRGFGQPMKFPCASNAWMPSSFILSAAFALWGLRARRAWRRNDVPASEPRRPAQRTRRALPVVSSQTEAHRAATCAGLRERLAEVVDTSPDRLASARGEEVGDVGGLVTLSLNWFRVVEAISAASATRSRQRRRGSAHP